jgi:hypothetical protein
MRYRKAVAIGLGVITLSGSSVSPAVAETSPPVTAYHGSAGPLPEAATTSRESCAKNSGAPSGYVPAQRFERAFRPYDALGASSFGLRRACVVTTVDITGASSGGSAKSVHIKIRKDDSGQLGAVRCSAALAAPGPSFTVPVSNCALRRDRTYWLVVQVRQHFGRSGQWYWAATDKARGHVALWKNPRDGFGTGCTRWSPIDCVDVSGGLLFSVNKA